jgi:hypothetical protein
MFHYNRFFSLLTFVCLLTLLSGCGPGGPPVQYVEGIVTLDGVPVEGANVNFGPKQASEESNAALVAGGITDAQGKYTISAVSGGKIGGGTTVGEYVVSVVKKTMTTPVGPSGPIGRPEYRYDVPMAFESRLLRVGVNANRTLSPTCQ